MAWLLDPRSHFGGSFCTYGPVITVSNIASRSACRLEIRSQAAAQAVRCPATPAAANTSDLEVVRQSSSSSIVFVVYKTVEFRHGGSHPGLSVSRQQGHARLHTA